MKKSYMRLYFLEAIIFILLLVNSLIYDFLSGYGMFFFLIGILVIFKLVFGFERERCPFMKDVIFEIVAILLLFFIVYYLIAIPIGFAKTPNYLSIHGLFNYLLPLTLSVLLQEFFRYEILRKASGCPRLIVTTVIMFIFLTITNTFDRMTFVSANSFFVFFSLSLLPAITENILCSYLSINAGYKPTIIYRLVMTLYLYLLPIAPDYNRYVKALIDFLFPVAVLFRIYKYFLEYEDKQIERDYNRHRFGIVVPFVIVFFLVYFVSGYFKYYAVAIATDSMNPSIKAGDMVIINQKHLSDDDIKVGSVIAYRHNGAILVHRVYNIIDYQNEFLIYTKGDANDAVDSWSVKIDDIIGEVVLKINWIGLPTVWVNKIFER